MPQSILFMALVEIGTEKNTTIVFPLPVDIISSVVRVFEVAAGRASRTREDRGVSRSRRRSPEVIL